MEYRTNCVQQTQKLAEQFATRLQPGDVVAFYGGLGAGKTAFTRGLAWGLGIQDAVTSPTYTVVNEYLNGKIPLFHFDMYRLRDEEDLFDIGWEDYLERGGVCVVEWSENVQQALKDAIRVEIQPVAGEDNSRKILITGGNRFENLSL